MKRFYCLIVLVLVVILGCVEGKVDNKNDQVDDPYLLKLAELGDGPYYVYENTNGYAIILNYNKEKNIFGISPCSYNVSERAFTTKDSEKWIFIGRGYYECSYDYSKYDNNVIVELQPLKIDKRSLFNVYSGALKTYSKTELKTFFTDNFDGILSTMLAIENFSPTLSMAIRNRFSEGIFDFYYGRGELYDIIGYKTVMSQIFEDVVDEKNISDSDLDEKLELAFNEISPEYGISLNRMGSFIKTAILAGNFKKLVPVDISLVSDVEKSVFELDGIKYTCYYGIYPSVSNNNKPSELNSLAFKVDSDSDSYSNENTSFIYGYYSEP